jgi:hypothetical protein
LHLCLDRLGQLHCSAVDSCLLNLLRAAVKAKACRLRTACLPICVVPHAMYSVQGLFTYLGRVAYVFVTCNLPPQDITCPAAGAVAAACNSNLGTLQVTCRLPLLADCRRYNVSLLRLRYQAHGSPDTCTARRAGCSGCSHRLMLKAYTQPLVPHAHLQQKLIIHTKHAMNFQTL